MILGLSIVRALLRFLRFRIPPWRDSSFPCITLICLQRNFHTRRWPQRGRGDSHTCSKEMEHEVTIGGVMERTEEPELRQPRNDEEISEPTLGAK